MPIAYRLRHPISIGTSSAPCVAGAYSWSQQVGRPGAVKPQVVLFDGLDFLSDAPPGRQFFIAQPSPSRVGD